LFILQSSNTNTTESHGRLRSATKPPVINMTYVTGCYKLMEMYQFSLQTLQLKMATTWTKVAYKIMNYGQYVIWNFCRQCLSTMHVQYRPKFGRQLTRQCHL